jgi:hypothetical protein
VVYRPAQPRRNSSSVAGKRPGQFGPVTDAELAVDRRDVRFDRPDADEQGGGRVPVAGAGRDQFGHPAFGGGQLIPGPGRGGTRQLLLDQGLQRPVTHGAGQLKGTGKRVPGLPPGPAPPFELAKHEQAASQFRAQR